MAPSPAKPPSIAQSEGSRRELLDFFHGTGTDIECRKLDQILAWDDTLMEVCHDYIQWVFPTDEASRFNSDAPILDQEAQRLFAADVVARQNLRRVLQRYGKFLGLDNNFDSREPGEPMKLFKAENFEKRMLMCWKGPQNHNWKRISRALRCLGLSGLIEEQQALLSCLEEILVQHPGMVEEVSVGRWMQEGCAKSKLVHTVTPGYITGVLHSPNLLSSLCTQYFHRYDVNHDGQLSVLELVDLARDLHGTLGLPLDTITENHLVESIARFTDNLYLCEELFPKWFQSELEHTVSMSKQLKVMSDEEVTRQRAMSKSSMGARGSNNSAASDLLKCRPEYLRALARSPQLLKTLCTKYFNTYDRDRSGTLDAQEAHKLIEDVNSVLGLSSESGGSTLQLVQESLLPYSGSQSTCLTADEFPAWFQGCLEQMIPADAGA